MKSKKKGFSLVELIVVLVIMAILAALCTPNIAAYVQAVKIQNYQTALNNLVDEVQTQLPQSRYWNWQEVQENAEAILRSDVARGVEDVTPVGATNQKVYEITNASTDGNIKYTITLEYVNDSNTSQKVNITASCDGYSTVSANESCDVTLKANYTDAEGYPMTSITVSTSKRGGWDTLGDFVATRSEWVERYGGDKADYWANYDFRAGGFPDSECLLVNTANYALTSVKLVQFEMNFFCTECNTGYSYAYPIVNTQAGRTTDNDGKISYGTGTQYAACEKDNLENVYIYIGSSDGEDYTTYVSEKTAESEILEDLAAHGWVKYSDIFSDAYGSVLKSTDGAARFLNYYYHNTSIVPIEAGISNNPKILYRVILKSTDGKNEGGLGWISIGGYGGNGCSVPFYPDKKGVSIYTEIADTPSSVDLNSDQYAKLVGNAVYGRDGYNASVLTVDNLVSTDRKYYYSVDWPSYGIPASLVTRKYNVNGETVETQMVYYYDNLLYGKSNSDYLDLNPYSISYDYNYNDGAPYFSGICKYSESLLYNYSNYKFDFNAGNWLNSISNNLYKAQYRNYWFSLNLSECQYAVGDILKIEFDKIDVDLFMTQFSLKSNTSFTDDGTISSFGTPPDYVIYPDYNHNKATVEITMGWNTYPFLYMNFLGTNEFAIDANITVNWGETTTSTTTVSSYSPMVAVNGDDSYANITLDWTKCDYITVSNVGNMHLEFNKDLDYQVFDKNYDAEVYHNIYGNNTFYLNQLGNLSGVIADGIVHLYCKNVDASSIVYELKDAPEPPEVAETTPVVTTVPTETTTTTVVPVLPETSTTMVSTTDSTEASTTTTEIVIGSTTTTEETTIVPDVAETTISETELTASETKETVETVVTTETEETAYQVSLDEESAKVCQLIPKEIVGKAYYFTIEPLSGYTFGNTVMIYANYDKYGEKYPCPGSISDGWYVTLSEDVSLHVDGIVEEITTTEATTTSETEKETTERVTTPTTIISTAETTTASNSNMLTLENFSFNQEYDVSPYFYMNEKDSRIPGKIEVTVSNAVNSNTGFNFYMLIRGSFNCQYSEYYSWNSTGDFKTYCTNDNNADTSTITFVLSSDNDVTHLTSFSDAKIKFSNSYASDTWNNIKVESIRFVYDEATEELARQDVDVAIYTSTDFIGPTRKNQVKSDVIATAALTTTMPKLTTSTTSTTTITTTTTAAIAASENGLRVGLDEESAEMCTITITSPLFNDSGVCYFTITPKEGYTLSEIYAVKVGTVTLNRSSNYSAKSNQWFFWKSSGLTEYTIHVSGITTDTVS